MKGFIIGAILGSIAFGIVIALFQLGVLQINLTRASHVLPTEYRRSEKQTIKLYIKKNGSWLSENLHTVLSDDRAQKIHRVVTQWLLFAFDEGMIAKPARVQTVFWDEKNNTFLLSFDRSFFSKESCLHDNLMLIEGLLKTLKDNNMCDGCTGAPARSVEYFISFYINYQPWEDRNLDFSEPWPVSQS